MCVEKCVNSRGHRPGHLSVASQSMHHRRPYGNLLSFSPSARGTREWHQGGAFRLCLGTSGGGWQVLAHRSTVWFTSSPQVVGAAVNQRLRWPLRLGVGYSGGGLGGWVEVLPLQVQLLGEARKLGQNWSGGVGRLLKGAGGGGARRGASVPLLVGRAGTLQSRLAGASKGQGGRQGVKVRVVGVCAGQG